LSELGVCDCQFDLLYGVVHVLNVRVFGGLVNGFF
jgi:hypothetical protein